jgi:hypothetical protein
MSPSTRYNDRAPILDGKACRASVQMSPHADTAAFPNAVSASPLSYSEPSPLTGLDQEYQRGRTMGFARAQPILRARKNICCVREPKFTSNKFIGNSTASRFVTASKKAASGVGIPAATKTYWSAYFSSGQIEADGQYNPVLLSYCTSENLAASPAGGTSNRSVPLRQGGIHEFFSDARQWNSSHLSR